MVYAIKTHILLTFLVSKLFYNLIKQKYMKLINFSKIGYNQPSQANWCYEVFKIDFIDTDRQYNGTKIVKSTFGGERRFEGKAIELGYKITETAGLYPCPKITGVSKMLDIESDEVIKLLADFLK